MEVRRQLVLARHWARLLIASVALAGLIGFLVSSNQPKTYESHALLIVGQSLSGTSPDYNQLLVSQRLSATYATLATTRPIVAGVIARLGLSVTPEELARSIQVAAAPDSALLSISARDGNPFRAAAIANALANGLIDASPAIAGKDADVGRALDEDLDAIRAQIGGIQEDVDRLASKTDRSAAEQRRLEDLQDQAISLRTTYANLLTFRLNNSANQLAIVEAAIVPDAEIAPRPLFTTILAAVVGLLVGSAIAFVAEYLDDSLKTPEVVEEALGLATLGSIGRMRGIRDRRRIARVPALRFPRSSAAEGFRTVRTNIEFASLERPVRTLLVTSAQASEGKSVTAANLAVVFAQAGRQVVLVDADLRRSTLHTLFRVENNRGLTTLLRNEDASIDDVAYPTEQPNLRLVTTGPRPPNPAELLGSHRMRTLLDRLRVEADLTIFDSPPLQVVTDAAVLSSLVDATVVVAHARQSRRAEVRRALESLRRADANILGVVLNGVRLSFSGDYSRPATVAGNQRPEGDRGTPG